MYTKIIDGVEYPLTEEEVAEYLQSQILFKKEAKELSVREDFKEALKQPVQDSNGIFWRGGEDSAASIKNGVEMTEFGGLTEITLRDFNRSPHVMSMIEARTVAATIGLDYQAKFQAKEEALLQLSQIDLGAPDAQAQIDAISFAAYLPQ